MVEEMTLDDATVYGETDSTPTTRRRRRRRWRILLIGGTAVMIGYYALVLASMRGQNAGAVALHEHAVALPTDRVTLQVEAADLDASTGSLDIRLRPVPRGSLADDRGGSLREPLQVWLSSPGEPPVKFDFPAQQVIDPVAASVETSTDANGFPFDRARTDFRLEALSEGERVPVDLEMADETEGWNLSGRVHGDDGAVQVDLDGGRELLAVSFAMFYIGGIVVVALITVAVIGGAIARGQVGFEQVIWLGAMLVAIPAVRNEMPGVPPVGTAVDLFVFLPSVVIVGLALLAAIVVLAINEAAASAPAAEGE